MKASLILFLLSFLVIACAPTPAPTAIPQTQAPSVPTAVSPTQPPAQTERDRTLIVAFSRDATTLDPAVYYDFEGQMLMDAVYEQLVTYRLDDAGKAKIVPKLAERWEVSQSFSMSTEKPMYCATKMPRSQESAMIKWSSRFVPRG